MQGLQRPRGNSRAGFTLTEVLVAVAIGVILSTSVVGLMVTLVQSFGTQSRQQEVNWRAREFISTFSTDAQAAYQVVYSGTQIYVPPPLTAPAAYNTAGPQGQQVTSVPGGTKVVVFQVPSYNASGIIPNSYDYIGYTWLQSTGIPGTIYRTVMPTSGSSRAPVSQIVPAGGTFDAALVIQFHVSETFSAVPGYAGHTYLDNGNAINGTGVPIFQGATPVVGVAYVDQVFITLTVSVTTWGTQVTQTEGATVTEREWGRVLGSTGNLAGGPPSAPGGITAISGSNRIALSWNPSTGAATYNIKRSILSDGPYLTIATTSSLSYTDRQLIDGITYFYVLSASDGSGIEGSNSGQVSAVPGNGPSPPTGLSTSYQNGTVVLAWVAAGNASYYDVKRSLASGGPFSSIGTTASTSFTDSTVTASTTYYYAVASVSNGNNEGADSSQVSITTPSTPPGAPTSLQASPFTDHSLVAINLSWNQSPGGNIVQNRVYRSQTSGSGYSLVAALPASQAYQDTGLSSGTTYFYLVTAIDGLGQESAYSSQASGTAL